MKEISVHDCHREVDCIYDDEKYSVRDNGAVMRHPRTGKRPRPTDNKWTFGKPNNQNGYMYISQVRIHRIVATAFHGEPPTPEHVVDHIDTNRRNNRPENLRWLTRLENALLNPITVKRIEFICGSIEAFLADPSTLRHGKLEHNFEWMRTVSREEADACRKRMHLWAKSDQPASSGGSLGEWIFKPVLSNLPLKSAGEAPRIVRTANASTHLKTALIDAIKQLHPEHVFKITDQESQKCAQFLLPYLEHGGSIFTSNYDILLYWVLMRNKAKNHIDGFGRDWENEDEPEEEPVFSELRWGNNKAGQNIHYLHGALPIFDTGIHIIKEEYDSEGYLLQNIEKRLEAAEYPVFVAAGDGKEKLNHIVRNRYLWHCYEILSNIDGSLVTFGFGFGDNDHHIIDAINKAAKRRTVDGKFFKLFSVYIGVYSEDDKKHIENLVASKKFKCKINMFDARTAKVWR